MAPGATPRADFPFGDLSFGGLGGEQALRKLGEFIDAAYHAGNREALQHALARVGSLRGAASPACVELCDFFEANAWRGLRLLNYQAGQDSWTWNQAPLEHEVVCLRRALTGQRYGELPLHRRLQILTNLGNLMSQLGRTVEALEYFDKAIDDDAQFGMSVGNRGMCFLYYSNLHYDVSQQAILRGAARNDLARALTLPLEAPAQKVFSSALEQLDSHGAGRGLAAFALDEADLGTSEESIYRHWSLEQRLFLNPLNDLGLRMIAAKDVLQLPELVVDTAIGTTLHGFFNQLKQEFVAARWLAFEAVCPSPASLAAERIANGDLGLVDARDGARFGLRLEKMKLAFRAAYSIVDKTAVFVNAFFGLGAPAHRVTLRSVWYEDTDPKTGRIHSKLEQSNLPLRGLYWLSKDFVETSVTYVSAMEPEAQDVAIIRNRLEHQYLRITEQPRTYERDVGFSVSTELMTKRTMRLLRSARAALIYLVFAVHAQQRAQASSNRNVAATERLQQLNSEP